MRFEAGAMREKTGCEAQGSEALRRSAETREARPLGHMTLFTPPGLSTQSVVGVQACGELSIGHPKIAVTSNRTALCGRGNPSIRRKIIGHGTSLGAGVLGKQFALGIGFRRARRMFPLVHQIARQHGLRIFRQPLVQQRTNLFAEIGGVVKSGEFIALERIARSREKELPRWLHLAKSHVGLLRRGAWYINTRLS